MSPNNDPPTVLELRIHGVNNTPPHTVLESAGKQQVVDLSKEEKLSKFWALSKTAVAEQKYGSVRLEAYSWGGLVRGRSCSVLGTAARFGWVLLLPFGLSNVAYWSRRLPERGSRRQWWSGNGAASARLFGLGLTLLLVVTICEVTMDQVAAQCYPGGNASCGWRSRLFDFLVGQDISIRLLLASLIPLAALAGLWMLSRTSRIRYEQYPGAQQNSAARLATADGSDGSRRMLAAPDLWRGDHLVRGLARLHFAAGIATVVLASSWAAVFGTGAGIACRRPEDLFSVACWDQVASAPARDQWLFGGITVAAALVVLVAAVLICWRAEDCPDVSGDKHTRRRAEVASWLVLGIAGAVSAVHGWVMIAQRPMIAEWTTITDLEGRPVVQALSLPGINATPTIVVAVLAGLALSALAWRVDKWRWLALVLGALATAGVLLASFHPAAVLGVVCLAGVLIVLARQQTDTERDSTAWHGMAPGVLLGVALTTAMTLSTALVLVAGQWFNGGNRAVDLVSCVDEVRGIDPHLCVPPAYVWFGVGSVVTVAVVLLVVLILGATTAFHAFTGSKLVSADGLADAPGPRLMKARHWAALLHRPEPVVAILAAVGLLCVFFSVSGAIALPPGWRVVDLIAGNIRWLAHVSVIVCVVVGVGLVVAVAVGRHRPLGLIWDLICFLPRTTHPFGPPCYAERAVPELTDACTNWLNHGNPHPPSSERSATQAEAEPFGDRTIVLSAHSLGAVLAIAVLYALPASHRKYVRLVTYGTQLRPYFGRIFPELLGPAVLGTNSCPAARLIGIDPWASATNNCAAADSDSAVSMLSGPAGPLWRNLWRRTDYLGFPVDGYSPPKNKIDKAAEEMDHGAIAKHSDYQRTKAYEEALKELLGKAVDHQHNQPVP